MHRTGFQIPGVWAAICAAGVVALALGFPSGVWAKDRVNETKAAAEIVKQIRRADYEGDRAALRQRYAELERYADNAEIASKVRYWRGFALWRRAINGFNDGAKWKEQEKDLLLAIDEFKEANKLDGAFVDAKAGAASCTGYLLYLNMKNADRFRELLGELKPLLRELESEGPLNPRVLWVLGPAAWSAPPEAGGSQELAFARYERGLEAAKAQKMNSADPLEPTWGEPELLMNLSWSNLNKKTPDLGAAEQYARAALKLVPNWHYVRDILLPQIVAAQKEQN
jgi:hypothetical protein